MTRYLFLGLILLILSFDGKSQSGTNVYDDSYIHEVRLTFADTTFWDSLLADYNAVYGIDPIDFSQRKYIMAQTIEIDGVVLDSVGVRLKGLSSGFTISKRRHFKIDFGEFKDWKVDGIRKINLSNTYFDGAMLKDALVYDWFRDMGIPAPRTAYYKLYLNNEYWGLYLGVEQVDKNFLDDNFVLDDGNLYKPFNLNGLNWHGPNWSAYEDTLELRTNHETLVHTELYSFLEFINTASDSEFETGLAEVLDIDKYITHSAVDYFVSNDDSPFIGGRNYYLYADEFNGRITTIPWDYNFSFAGNLELVYNFPIVNPYDTVPVNVLRKRIQESPVLSQMYFDKVCELGQSFSSNYFDPLIDSKIDLISEQILLEPHSSAWMPSTEIELNSAVQNIKEFISNNANRISNDLSAQGYTCFLNNEDLKSEDIRFGPNPTTGLLNLNNIEGVRSITVVNSLGKKVMKKEGVEVSTISLDCSELNSGIYFVFVETDYDYVRLKFEKVN